MTKQRLPDSISLEVHVTFILGNFSGMHLATMLLFVKTPLGLCFVLL